MQSCNFFISTWYPIFSKSGIVSNALPKVKMLQKTFNNLNHLKTNLYLFNLMLRPYSWALAICLFYTYFNILNKWNISGTILMIFSGYGNLTYFKFFFMSIIYIIHNSFWIRYNFLKRVWLRLYHSKNTHAIPQFINLRIFIPLALHIQQQSRNIYFFLWIRYEKIIYS